MSFSGTWQVYQLENYKEFLKATAPPEGSDRVTNDVKPILEIQQNGKDFVITTKTPSRSLTNTFTIDQESEVTSMDGKKIKCTVRMEGGKIICQNHKFSHILEIKGDEMVEHITVDSTTLIRKSKKI